MAFQGRETDETDLSRERNVDFIRWNFEESFEKNFGRKINTSRVCLVIRFIEREKRDSANRTSLRDENPVGVEP